MIIKNIFYRNIWSYLNRRIFKWTMEKRTKLTASRRIDKCPIPGQRFSDKFPTAKTDKVTNAWQSPGWGKGTLGINWAIIDSSIRLFHISLPVYFCIFNINIFGRYCIMFVRVRVRGRQFKCHWKHLIRILKHSYVFFPCISVPRLWQDDYDKCWLLQQYTSTKSFFIYLVAGRIGICELLFFEWERKAGVPRENLSNQSREPRTLPLRRSHLYFKFVFLQFT